ncbi:hypothetical protein IIA16_01610 [bacterium]|nr:hypothetical protein [bacterium]
MTKPAGATSSARGGLWMLALVAVVSLVVVVWLPTQEVSERSLPAPAASETTRLQQALALAMEQHLPNYGTSRLFKELVAEAVALGTGEAVGALLGVLLDEDPYRQERWVLLGALWQIGSPEALRAARLFVLARAEEPWEPTFALWPGWEDHETSVDPRGEEWMVLVSQKEGHTGVRLLRRRGEGWAPLLWVATPQAPEGPVRYPSFKVGLETVVLTDEESGRTREISLDTAYADSDGDGLTDEWERVYQTDPLDPDWDKDGIPDGVDSKPLLDNQIPLDDTARAMEAAAQYWWGLERDCQGWPWAIEIVGHEPFPLRGFACAVLMAVPERGVEFPYPQWAEVSITLVESGKEGVTVRLRRFCGPMAGGGATLRMERREGVWVVAELLGSWVS